MSNPSLCQNTAAELARMIREKQVSAVEVMEAHLAQIEKINPRVNAIVTLDAEGALAQARAADEALAKGERTGVLHGLPIGVKDLVPTKGMRTTFGSPIYRDNVPDADALIVERERRAGAIVVGKTNTPEFGAGSQTFNQVFGETRNPWDLSKTCGGSSGGSAVALACRMLPLADGSDLGGSLRNPASFCNVVGLRPSPGRVPSYPSTMAWFPLSVLGPMGRTAQDAALLLAAIAGSDPRHPISVQEPGGVFQTPLERDFKGAKIAWSPDLGSFPVGKVVQETIERHLGVFRDMGCEVTQDHPDVADAERIFLTLRAFRFAQEHGERLKKHRDLLKDTVIWNTEEGLKLKGTDISQAEADRTALYHRVRIFLEKYDFLVLPSAAVPPFPVEQPFIEEINGVKMASYISWMAVCFAITITGLPAISVPCGFTPEGLPIGLQIVGRHRQELGVLQLAHAFEQATRYHEKLPPVLEG